MSIEPEFLLEEDEIDVPISKFKQKDPWYKKLPQANLRPEGKLAARAVLGAAQLHPLAIGLDLASLATQVGLQQGGTEIGKKIIPHVPSSQDIIKPLEHLAGLEENPTGAERVVKNLGEYIQLAKGRGLRNRLIKAAGLTVGEEAAGGLLGEDARTAYKTVAPLGVKGAEPILTGRQNRGQSTLSVAVQNNPELRSLYDYGRSIGLTDAQLAPILQPDIKTRLLGRFAKKTHGMRAQIDETRNQIGSNYRRLKAQGRNDLLTPTQQNALFNDLADLHQDLSRTNVIGADTQAILTTLEEALNRMTTQPQTVETLINSYQNINQIPNWNAITDGRRRLMQVNRHFERAIASRNPRIAEEFALTNRMYQRQANLRRDIGMGRVPESIFTVAETAGLLSGLAYGAVTGDYGNAAKIIGISASRRLATQLLTNPRLQGLHRNMMTALTSGDQTAIINAFKKLEPILKEEAPEEWGAANSPEFILED